MSSETNEKLYQTWDKFLKVWSVEKVKNMTLEQYSKVGKNSTFTWWIEHGLSELGGIGGGSAFKFGIFSRGNQSDKKNDGSRMYGDEYAWYQKYGQSPEEAFNRIKSEIIKVIDAVQNGKLDDIDDIDDIDLGKAYKWKIAFLYQNREIPHIVNVFKQEMLESKTSLTDNKMSKLYKVLMEQRKSMDLLSFGRTIWEDDANKESINVMANCLGNSIPLNQILYGPPGTGKTFNTVKKAVEICDGKKVYKNYDEVKKRYTMLKEERQIEFVTFHQSYGYEDFIEGIRAKPDDGQIKYTVESGILKKMVENMGSYSKSSGSKQVDVKTLLIDFSHAIQEKILQSEKPLLTIDDNFKKKTFFGEVKSFSDGSFQSFVTTGSVKNQNLAKNIILRDYQSFYNGEIKSALDIKPVYKSEAASHGNAMYYYQLFLVMREFQEKSDHKYLVGKDEKVLQPYVLIIDEINRGNISKIFGELITLIEKDKRLGNANAMTVRLPGSNDEFGVPNNLYIIGTMNTADRSIAMMDTALRRRFEFEEMMPNPCLLHAELNEENLSEWENFSLWDLSNKNKDWIWDKDWVDDGDLIIERVNLRRLLYAINQRIEVLYDREHTIGHAFFMSLSSNSTIAELAAVFENKVIPLLAEYFFEDWGKIRLVLGDNQKGGNTSYQFVVEKKGIDYQKLFGSDAFDYSDERKIYERNPEALNHAESYIGIYDPIATITELDSE